MALSLCSPSFSLLPSALFLKVALWLSCRLSAVGLRPSLVLALPPRSHTFMHATSTSDDIFVLQVINRRLSVCLDTTTGGVELQVYNWPPRLQ